MIPMGLRWLGVCLASTVALAAQSALAQPVNGCPAGQAMQSSDASGQNVTCVPIPPPVDLGPLQAADAALLGAINDETQARIAADNELRASIGGGAETSIVGTYTFSGTQSCLNSTFGFNPNLTPIASTDPMRAAVVSISTALATGSRTFNADGTGTAQQTTMSINYPGAFYSSSGFAGVTTGGPSPAGGPAIPGGNVGTIFQETISFNWNIEDGRLIIQDAISPGIFTSGGRIGWSARVEGVPRSVGVLGKDVRVISITNENVAVETTVTTSPATEPFQEFRTPRICQRERTLRKL
jgi:hypothetical protein